MLSPHSSPTLRALLDQGRLAEARGRHLEARELYECGLHSLAPASAPEMAVQLLIAVGRTHLASGSIGPAREVVEAAIALAQAPGLEGALATALAARGRMRRLEGELVAAQADFVAARHHALSVTRHDVAALSASELATLAELRGVTDEAVQHMEIAVSDFRAASDHAGAARALERLASLYAFLKRWNAAEQAFAEAAAPAPGEGEDARIAELELARADMALDRANVERASASATRALEAARRAGEGALVARAVLLQGIVARETGDLPLAQQCLEHADRQAQSREDLLLQAEVAKERADLFARQERHGQALQALDRAYRALIQLRGRELAPASLRRARRLESGFMDVVSRWAQRMESHDHATVGHCERVADLTCEIAQRMGVDRATLYWYRVGALLHDIGKLEVPATVLNKAGRLTTEEWALVKRHPVAGARMLQEVDFPWEVRPIVESHHECWDGTGYPHGLAGEEIPLAARIFAVADGFDALVSRRPFRQALAPTDAVDVMRRDVGRQFDPRVFGVFEQVLREGVAIPGITSAAALPAPRAEPGEVPLLDDSLTSVAVHASWMPRAARLLAERRAAGHPVALLSIDVDHFARVNAAYGRLQGDDILWAVAKVLQRGLRTEDLIGRRGSDEFLVLLPDTAPDTAREVADRLRDATSRLRCARRDESDDAITVTVSIAVSSSPHDGETVDLLLTAADRTLARAKREGRDRVVVAQDDGTASAPAGLDFGAFVSREDEVRVLVAQLELAARDNARVVCLTGEEGIGKTALVRQLEPEVGRRDGTVLHVQSLLGDHGSPYGVWSDVIARLHSLELLVERDWKALPRLVPSIGPSRDGDDWALTPSLLREEIVRAVRRAARDRLLVLVFEDMHWADHASWEVMDALLAAVDRERLLVVITARSQESGATEQALGRITRHPRVSHIALQRFSIAEVRRWTQALMGDADPGDELPRFLHSYTEGVPLFMVHVLHALAAAGDLWLDDTRWEWRPVRDLTLPPGVGFVLERRLERLSPGTRDILAIAAVLGNSFPVDLLVAASALPEDEVRTALHDAALAGVVQPSADGREGSATFAHDVLADACRRTLVERQRQGIHEVCARLLELRAPSDVVAITSHYHAAGLDGEAYRFAVSAADRASAVFSHDTEIAALQVAQRHTPSPRDLALLRARLARTTHTAGRHVSAEEFCDLALEGLDSEADASAVAAVRRLRERVRVQRGGSPQRALHALHLLCTGDPSEVSGAERATSFLVAAELRASMADWSLAATLVRRSLEVAGDAAEADFRGNAARVLGISRYPSVPMEGLALLHESVARLGASTDRAGEARARLALGDLYVRGGHVTHAEEALADALDLARGVHSASIVALISRSLAELHGRRGDFEQASRWMRDAERLFASLGDRPERLRTIVSAAHIARDHGDRARAHALYESACDTARALEVPWIELTALAGSALTNGGPDASSARERWQRASELLAGVRADWWFPGRELLDALSLQMALAAGHSGVAFETFTRASHLLERVEPYAAAWLVAECGEELERAGLPAIGETRRLAAQRAAVLHFAPLIPRLGSA